VACLTSDQFPPSVQGVLSILSLHLPVRKHPALQEDYGSMESIDYVSFWLSSPIIPIEEMMITGRPVGIQNERWKNSKIHHFRGID